MKRSMTEDLSKPVVTDVWSRLLEETRLALATLRAEDLEELSSLAENLAGRYAGAGLHSGQISGISSGDMLDMIKAHRLLGDLLVVTDRNYQFLRRLQGHTNNRVVTGKREMRWVL